MITRLILVALLLPAWGCDSVEAQRGSFYAAPEAVVASFPYPLDLDDDGDDVVLVHQVICTHDVPPSACASRVTLAHHVYGTSEREVAFLLLDEPLAEGDPVGPYPDAGSGELTRPRWSSSGPPVGYLTADMIAGVVQPSEPVDGLLVGVRLRVGAREHYGWVRLSGRAENSGEGGMFGWHIRAVVHAYALGADGQVVRAGVRP